MEDDTLKVLLYYPRIYLACHREHNRSQSTKFQVSARDATILSHIASPLFNSPTRLARHLNVSKATLSEALAKLTELGFVTTSIDGNDSRKLILALTDLGIHILRENSVLDYNKVSAALATVDAEKRQRIVEGLALFAETVANLSE